MGLTLQELRVNAGLSREDLGKIADVSSAAIRTYEINGRRPNPATAKKIADRFGLKVTDLWPVEERDAA